MPVMTDSKPSKETLKSMYSVTTRIDEFRRAARADNMIKIFDIPLDYDASGRPSSERTIDLFTQYKEVSLSTVRKASHFYSTYGGPFTAENCNWTGLKLLNSCEEDLRERILGATANDPRTEQSGIVYFKIMMNHVVSTSESHMRTIQDHIRALKLTEFDGENVSDAVSSLRGLTEQLSNHSALPGDIIELIANVMRGTTVSKFETYVDQTYGYHRSGLVTYTLSSFFDAMEKQYQEMSGVTGRWTAATVKANQGSVFFSGNCRYCNIKGHKQNDCRKYKADQAAGRAPADGGRGGGRSGGRGRGGRGGRSGGGRGQYNVDRTPPKAGQPHERDTNGHAEKWCGSCKRWGNHLTVNHRAWDANRANRTPATAAAATTAPAPVAAPVPAPAPTPTPASASNPQAGHVSTYGSGIGAISRQAQNF